MLIMKLREAGIYEKLRDGRRLTKKETTVCDAIRAEFDLDDRGLCRTQGQLAKALGVSRQTINRWCNDDTSPAPMPRENDGRYNPVLVHEWSLEFNPARDPEGADGQPGSERAKWETMERMYKAKMQMLNYERALGEVIDRAAVESELVDRIIELKKSLQAFSRRLAYRLEHKPAAEIMAILDDEVRQLLDSYSRPLESLEDVPADETKKEEDDDVV